jgi:curved DNA-binding protein CbpA
MSSRSLYDILNVSQGAEPVVIEAAYKALMKRHHPDQAPDPAAASRAAEINEAFAVLKNPARRSEYDHWLWSRQQAHRAAELRALDRPARSRYFGWSGWLVAGLLAASLASLVTSRSVVPRSIRVADEAGEAERGEADLIRAAVRKAAAADAKTVAPAPASSAAILARVLAEAEAMPAATNAAPRSQAPRGARAVRPAVRPSNARAARATPARPRQARERDFMERQGYIY